MTWLLAAPVLIAGGFAVLAGAALGFAPWPWARWAGLALIAVGAAPWLAGIGLALSDGW